jgi:hypothetical protein
MNVVQKPQRAKPKKGGQPDATISKPSDWRPYKQKMNSKRNKKRTKKMTMVNAILYNLRGLCPPDTNVRWTRRMKLLRATDGLAAITDFSWTDVQKNGGGFIFHLKWLDDEGHFIYGTHTEFLADSFNKYCARVHTLGDRPPKSYHVTRDLQIETSQGVWEIFQKFLPNAVRTLQPDAVAKWLVERDGILACPSAKPLPVRINTPPPVATFTFKSLRDRKDWTTDPFAEANKKLASKPPRRALPPPAKKKMKKAISTPTPFPSPATPIYHQSKLLASPVMSPLVLDANSIMLPDLELDMEAMMPMLDLLDDDIMDSFLENSEYFASQLIY